MEERGHDNNLSNSHCVKSVLIQSCSGPYFLSFGRNTEIYVQTWENRPEQLQIRTFLRSASSQLKSRQM